MLTCTLAAALLMGCAAVSENSGQTELTETWKGETFSVSYPADWYVEDTQDASDFVLMEYMPEDEEHEADFCLLTINGDTAQILETVDRKELTSPRLMAFAFARQYTGTPEKCTLFGTDAWYVESKLGIGLSDNVRVRTLFVETDGLFLEMELTAVGKEGMRAAMQRINGFRITQREAESAAEETQPA